ncbi:hypothetical protein BD324DRAFT_613462 [Kockovaella imperatae]|uniref:Uncharacterized protein n=1 Tax=Kockovaella imperatae TaxID=4999 RepID=A0A1Y1UT24_9TREE|nr:hypothetical protein BD324DRAFT_613462 [Kockovaella imperatae]ORX41161.1 hypothetical protein BD324DRAFT_613462 [Kockovaella imperatae]
MGPAGRDPSVRCMPAPLVHVVGCALLFSPSALTPSISGNLGLVHKPFWWSYVVTQRDLGE